MDVVFEGALKSDWGMKNVLQSILEEPPAPWSMLRISAANSKLQGKIIFTNGEYVIGSFCTGSPSDVDPYEALRTTLSISEGIFTYLTLTQTEAANFEHTLYISITRLIESLNELPTQGNRLFDEKGLLDKVFGDRLVASSEDVAQLDFSVEPKQPEQTCTRRKLEMTSQSSEVRAQSASVETLDIGAAPITSWKTMDKIESITGTNMLPEFAQSKDSKSVYGKLRGLPGQSNGKFSWQRLLYELRGLQWLPLFLFLIGLASFLAPQVWPTGGNDGGLRHNGVKEAARPVPPIN